MIKILKIAMNNNRNDIIIFIYKYKLSNILINLRIFTNFWVILHKFK